MSSRIPATNSLAGTLGHSLFFLTILAGILVIVIAMQSIFTVGSQELGLIRRFGKLQNIVGTGTYYCWPYPIETTQKIPFQKEMSIAISTFRRGLPASAQYALPETLDPETIAYLVTADQGILFMQNCTLSFTIDTQDKEAMIRFLTAYPEQRDFLGTVTEPAYNPALRQFLAQSAVKAAAEMKTEEIIRQPAIFGETILTHLRRTLQKMQFGIQCQNVIANAAIPEQIADAYAAVGMGRAQEQQQFVESRKKAAQLTGEGQTERGRILSRAQTDAARRIGSARAAADYFSGVHPSYLRDPEGIRSLLRDRSLNRIFAHADEIIIFDEKTIQQLSLNLTRHPATPKKKKRTDEK